MLKKIDFTQGKTVYTVDGYGENTTVNKFLIKKRLYKTEIKENFYQKLKGIDENGMRIVEQGFTKNTENVLCIVNQKNVTINVENPLVKFFTNKKQLNKEVKKRKILPFVILDEFHLLPNVDLKDVLDMCRVKRTPNKSCKIYA